MPDASLRSLVDDLASPDPAVRDERAYAALAGRVRDGDLSADDRSRLASAMLERLDHERAEDRAFAPLVLASLVAAGDFDAVWVPSVTRWYVGEQDLRGHDPELGWVHAVADGADFFGECGAAGVGDAAAQVLHGDEAVTVVHSEVVRQAVAALLAEVTPWFWRRVDA
ncbi:DUF2785 domain-containing protein [Terrabacter sp. Root181]|uniref:DUF2785 domain-containing protein n=1 Tax=Terrabacter sp. Root181 TaxID=1736484 RepID=UPI0006FE152A|nr:DUF2785 domain-containing protein [Terrabacter sp. Root181]KRB47830.1 hypothetical protein ASD90_05855 [Terrabacter sp. Root181]